MKGLTLKRVCTIIEKSKVLIKNDGTNPTADEIWNYSPTGELFMIWEWWYQAKMKLLIDAIMECDGLLYNSSPAALLARVEKLYTLKGA
jgi:hypothetical protein